MDLIDIWTEYMVIDTLNFIQSIYSDSKDGGHDSHFSAFLEIPQKIFVTQ